MAISDAEKNIIFILLRSIFLYYTNLNVTLFALISWQSLALREEEREKDYHIL